MYEEQIKDVFVKAANILIKDKADAVRRIESIRDSLLVNDSFQKSLDQAETEISVVSGLMDEYVRSTVLTESEVENGRYAELQTRYEAAVKNAEKARLQSDSGAGLRLKWSNETKKGIVSLSCGRAFSLYQITIWRSIKLFRYDYHN